MLLSYRHIVVFDLWINFHCHVLVPYDQLMKQNELGVVLMD